MSVSAAVDRTTPAVRLRIGAELLERGSGGTFDHVNPATGEVDATIPLAGPAEVDRAVQAAGAAFQTWRRTPPAERRRLLLRLADLIEANSAEFGRLGSLDNGVAISIANNLAATGVEWTRYYAGWADKLTSEVTSAYGASRQFGYTLGQPYGVIGVIITWNGPLVSLCMKLPAALAAGNTVVVKPSELTPFSAELFARLVAEAGFPDGVVNVLPGTAEAGAALVEHPLVRKVTFTGGPVTGRKILEACAPQMKPVVMELGGKSAHIVFADANLDAACTFGTFFSIGAMTGQGCALPTRLLVQREVYDEAVEKVAGVAANIPVGDPFDPATIAGPVISEAAMERILGMIERAKGEARLVAGGARIDRPGFFIEPTVFADVPLESELAQTEVFGPVLAISPFEDEADAIRLANGTPYGLSGYVQTRNLKRAHRVAEALTTGEVLINGAPSLSVDRPFGGIGLSGFGKEGGRLGIEEFLWTKSVGIG